MERFFITLILAGTAALAYISSTAPCSFHFFFGRVC